nr:hypothetical protein [Tanacetum cinerariifolium]
NFLKDLKELEEYDQSTSTDRPIFLNDNEDHLVQNKESPEKSSEETVVLKTNQEPPQDSDIHQLIKECSIKVPEEQKQKMENTMFELVKICQEKEFLCIHDDVDNFRVVHKSSISFKDTSQISSIHSIAPIQSTKEPEHSLSMGYEHFSITPETKSDKVTESNVENLLPIPGKCEVTLEDEIECDMPANDDCSPVFTTFSNPLFKDNDDLDSSNDESLPDEDVPAEDFKIYSNPLCDKDEINSNKLDPHCFNVESDFVESLLNRDTFIDFSSKFDFSGELAHIKPEIPKSDFDFEEEILQDGNSQHEEINIVTETDDVLPPGIENFADDLEGDIRFLEELFINDFIFSDELSDANFEENSLILRPPPEPPDAETDVGEEIPVMMISKDKFDDDSQIFMFDKVLSLLSAESEDTIFDPGLSPKIEIFLCWNFSPVSKIFISFML